MAEEGIAIACHSVDEWTRQLEQANESKKLVAIFQILSSIFHFRIIFHLQLDHAVDLIPYQFRIKELIDNYQVGPCKIRNCCYTSMNEELVCLP